MSVWLIDSIDSIQSSSRAESKLEKPTTRHKTALDLLSSCRDCGLRSLYHGISKYRSLKCYDTIMASYLLLCYIEHVITATITVRTVRRWHSIGIHTTRGTSCVRRRAVISINEDEAVMRLWRDRARSLVVMIFELLLRLITVVSNTKSRYRTRLDHR